MKTVKLIKRWTTLIAAISLLATGIHPVYASEMDSTEEISEAETENIDMTVFPIEEETEELYAGNSMSDATSIPLSGTVNGNLNANSYGEGNATDFYKISVSENSSVCLNIRIVQYINEMTVRVYDNSSDKIIEKRIYWNSNLQQGTNDLECYLNPGNYYIELSLPFVPNSGNYTMQLSCVTMGNIDTTYDDTIASARPINLTATFTGVMAHGEESDIYRFDVTKPGIISCKFKAYMEYIYLKLLDKDGNTLWSKYPHWNSNIGYSTNDYQMCLEKGTYYLQVYKDGNTGKYTMQNVFTDIGSNEIENNDTIVTANSIAFEQTYNGLMADGETSDFYKFVLPQNTEIRINFQAYIQYVYLKLYDVYGNELKSNYLHWNENIGYSNDIYAYELSAGTYYLQIRSD
ncbi:MAG: hypothetical protein NC124_21230, partial [Clostridium sp.]|nr:hypothetical protein [Clostridium sp.]